jgi:hypothetical protein
MADLHVETLRYTLVPREGVTYRDGVPAIERDLGRFSVRLAAGELTVTMRDHFESTADAQAAVDPYPRAWQAFAALETNRPEFEFKYTGARKARHSIDRDWQLEHSSKGDSEAQTNYWLGACVA